MNEVGEKEYEMYKTLIIFTSMDFNFYDQFRNYSNVELLRITADPGSYQPAALAAAEKLLKERNISWEDNEATAQYFEERAAGKETREKELQGYKRTIMNVMEPLAPMATAMPPARWFKYFIGVFGVLYVRNFYYFVQTQIHFLQCKDCQPDPIVLLNFIRMSYWTVEFFFFFSNKRWGWILLMVEQVCAVCGIIYQFYWIYKYGHVVYISPLMHVLDMVIPIVFVTFLSRPNVAAFFGISPKVKRRTVWAGIALGIIDLIYLFTGSF